MAAFMELGPPKLSARIAERPPDATKKVYTDLIKLRKGIGGLKAVKAKAKDGEKTVPFAVKSAAVLMNKFRAGLDKLNMLCYCVGADFSIIPRDKGSIAYAVYTIRIVSSDGSYLDVVATSQGADTQDKAAGKCMTYGWKFALIYALCLPDADIKEDWGSDELEDSDSSFEPTNEPAGITPVNPQSYVDRVIKAATLDEYTAVITEARAVLTVEQLSKISPMCLKHKESLIANAKIQNIADSVE